MKPIIKVENLSKQYRLGGNAAPQANFREAIVAAARAPFEKFRQNAGQEQKKASFWALKDVSFEIYPGEVVGIIGRNGAGKSTLLKILSRITEPTQGKIELYGRVGSLLEVGTGFHQELTGRENIFLNGAILGMRREEIARKFDEIVDFSEIEKFIDTPVKYYSSGMYMRLAFAVAANLEPETLIVDEVLAVGDAEFQKKCLGKMKDVSEHGRTVLFVSHQMGSIAQLCQKALLLDKGQLIMEGATNLVIDHYTNKEKSDSTGFTAALLPDSDMQIVGANVLSVEKIEQSSFRHDEAITVRVETDVKKFIRGSEVRMKVTDYRNILVFTDDVGLDSLDGTVNSFAVKYKIPADTMRPGTYSVTLELLVPHQFIIETVSDALAFSVYDGGTKFAQSEGMDYGVVFSPCKTSVTKLS